MSAPADIVTLVVALLSDHWLSANTHGITPDFKTGWFDDQGEENQVIVSGVADESAMGTSGVAGITPTGVAQILHGMVFVECIAEEPTDGSHNPKELAHLFVREVQRIVMAHVNTVAGYDYISFLGFNKKPPVPSERPFAAWNSCKIGYGWRLET